MKRFLLLRTYKPAIFKIEFPNSGPTYKREMANPRHEAPQEQ